MMQFYQLVMTSFDQSLLFRWRCETGHWTILLVRRGHCRNGKISCSILCVSVFFLQFVDEVQGCLVESDSCGREDIFPKLGMFPTSNTYSFPGYFFLCHVVVLGSLTFYIFLPSSNDSSLFGINWWHKGVSRNSLFDIKRCRLERGWVSHSLEYNNGEIIQDNHNVLHQNTAYLFSGFIFEPFLHLNACKLWVVLDSWFDKDLGNGPMSLLHIASLLHRWSITGEEVPPHS